MLLDDVEKGEVARWCPVARVWVYRKEGVAWVEEGERKGAAEEEERAEECGRVGRSSA